MSRRGFLALGGASALGALTGCGSGASLGRPNELTMWTWIGSVNDGLISEAEKGIPGTDKKLLMTRIGTNYKTKVLTSLAGKSLVPDIIAMNDDVATYFPNADSFVNLFDLGAGDVADQYLEWKWKLGITPDNKMIAFPMDTGPTALFYRYDVFQQAGVAAEPADVAEAAPTWDAYIQLVKQVQQKVPEAVMTDDISTIYRARRAQMPKRFMTPEGEYIGDQDHIREAWELAIKVGKDGLSAGTKAWSTDSYSLLGSNRWITMNHAVWWAQLGPKNAAPDTKGKWRVTDPPGGAGNWGGSFLGISKYCKDPEAAFKFITWLESPKNQAEAFVDPVLFPSTPATFDEPKLEEPDEFFGGQVIVDVFAKSAEQYPGTYFSPYDNIINAPLEAELVNVEAGLKTSDQAWNDAQALIARELRRVGAI